MANPLQVTVSTSDKKVLRSMWVTDAQWAALEQAGNGNASRAVREYADLLRCTGCDRYVLKGCPVHDTEVPSKRRSKVAPSNS